jgi:hypothetical membrane protein
MKQRRRDGNRASTLVLLPAAVAPLVLVGGWSLAASAQSGDYNGFRDTLSSLAALGVSHRGIMTWTFVLLGLAHLGTAALLRVAARPGRVLQALGGLATIAVALLPLSSESEGYGHAAAATVAFVALALWAAFAARSDGPPVLRPAAMRTASVVLALLVGWFGVALVVGHLVGLAERVAALAEALWPLVVAWMVREWGGGSGTPRSDPPVDPPVPEDEFPTIWSPRPSDEPAPVTTR